MFKNKNIFFLEDELIIAKMIIEELEELGAKCVHTVNYNVAVEKCLEMKYDIIISDIRVEGGTGDDLIKIIKEDKNHINFQTPIVVTSAYLSKELLKSVGDKVCVALNKPHTVKTLLDALEQHIN